HQPHRTQPSHGPVLDHDAVARRHLQGVVGRARIRGLAQHHTGLGPGAGVGLRGHTRADGSVRRQPLPDEVELVRGVPDVVAAARDGPGATAQVLVPYHGWVTDVAAAPPGRTWTGRWLGRCRRAWRFERHHVDYRRAGGAIHP